MKKLTILRTLLIMLFACFYSNLLPAQFLKQIMNSVNQTAQNRANNKAQQTTNKSLDKVDNSVFGKSNSSAQRDSASTNKVLGAFAKTAADNPNDTSSADLITKALGNLAGGGGVSAADSAAAINNFTNASGGTGFYYQYVTTITSKQRGSNSDTSTSILTSGGEGRKEMNLPGMMGVKGGKTLTILARAKQPRYSVVLDAAGKTYSLNVIDTSLINSNRETYQVTKIGNETIQGYSCIHSKLVSTAGKGMFKSTTTMDIWTSTGIPGYDLLKKLMTIQNVTPKMMQALEQAGCGGFFVKMSAQGKDYSMNMMLIKAQEKTFSSSLFKIPAGYAESKSNLLFGSMMGAMPKK